MLLYALDRIFDDDTVFDIKGEDFQGKKLENDVFHEGQVIQQGTHAELVADETGKYHELWHAQAQYYTEKTA